MQCQVRSCGEILDHHSLPEPGSAWNPDPMIYITSMQLKQFSAPSKGV